MSGSAGALHTWPVPCYSDTSMAQPQRRLTELDSASAIQPPEHHSSSKTTAGSVGFVHLRALEDDGFGPTSHGPATSCVDVDAVEVVDRASNGVSYYSIGEPANMLRTTTLDLHQATSECDLMIETPADSDPAASNAVVQVTTQLTTPQTRCGVLHLAVVSDCASAAAACQEDETMTSCEGHGPLHNALQAQCAKLLHQNHTYSDVENHLLPPGICTTMLSLQRVMHTWRRFILNILYDKVCVDVYSRFGIFLAWPKLARVCQSVCCVCLSVNQGVTHRNRWT